MKGKRRKAVDVAFLHGPTEDGQGARVVRFTDGAISAGEVRPAREGEPLHDRELVRLRPLHAQLPLCEVEVLHGPEREASPEQAPPAEADKPGARRARVSTDSYRR